MYSKTKQENKGFFNSSYIELVRKIKIICKELLELTLPLENEYKVIETNASEDRWGAVLLSKLSKYDSKSTEKICRCSSRLYKKSKNSLKGNYPPITYVFELFQKYIIINFFCRTSLEVILFCTYLLPFSNC